MKNFQYKIGDRIVILKIEDATFSVPKPHYEEYIGKTATIIGILITKYSYDYEVKLDKPLYHSASISVFEKNIISEKSYNSLPSKVRCNPTKLLNIINV